MTDEKKTEEFEYHVAKDFLVGPAIPDEVFDEMRRRYAETEAASGADPLTHTIEAMMDPLSPVGEGYETKMRLIDASANYSADPASYRPVPATDIVQLTGLDDGPPLIEPTPQLPKLTPEELAAFRPKCAYCGDTIDVERVKRRKRTCSDYHTKLLTQYRRYQWSMMRCPSCYRPSTPEERKEFKAWRAGRGDKLKEVGRGRPSKTREHQLVEAIKAQANNLRVNAGLSEDPSIANYLRDTAATLESILSEG